MHETVGDVTAIKDGRKTAFCGQKCSQITGLSKTTNGLLINR
jgi:hypothetical protein